MGLFWGKKKQTRKPSGKGRAEPRLFEEDAPHPGRGKRPPAKKRRSVVGWLFRLLFALGFWSGIAIACLVAFTWFSLNQQGLFQIPQREPGVMLLASDGSEIAEQGTFFGDAVVMSELPDYVPNAIIAIEDRRYYSHYGVDPIGISRAMFRNAMQGHMREGGSTLTQQLAKNLFLSHERTFTRKAQELVFAIWLEIKFSKDEILQLYLNRVYFGGGANGIDKASRTFYGKSAYELSLMEAATLAGVLKAPTTYNPARNPEEALARAKLVLNSMVDEGFVTREEAQDAIDNPSKAASSDFTPATQYAVDWINGQLPLLIKKQTQSLIIETTIEPNIQAQAENVLRKRLADNAAKLNVSQGAVVTMDGTGAIRALVGGRSYKRSQFNRATEAKRQPGSAFKAFVYLAALENGYRPDSIEVDAPLTIGNWSPENYKRKYLGPVALTQAYALSLNTVAARLAVAITPKSVTQVAQRLGITSKLGQDASIALGTSEVSLLEMTTAFTPFANGGKAVEPYIVKRILGRDGTVLYERGGDGLGQVVGQRELGDMNAMMRQVVLTGTGTKARFDGQDIGGKTGTSQDYRDAWFVGYTPYLITGVWMGNDDNSPTKKVTGGSLPALVWHDIMQKAHQDLPELPLPGREEEPQQPDMQVSTADVNEVIEPAPPVAKPTQQPDVRKTQRKKRERSLLARIFGGNEDQPVVKKKKLQSERAVDDINRGD
jgi:penicillin-binding protein 1A